MENERRVRIADIAEELGVSTATVSNVIHGKTKKISDRTVQRVSELLEEKQYIPSMAGILLAQNDSRIIGIVVNDHEKYESRALEDVFIASSLSCLSAEIEKAGCFMMVKVTKELSEIVRFASMWNMEGLIVMGFCGQDYKKLRGLMRVPFVVYDGYFAEAGRVCNFAIDDYDGGFQMGNYFKSMGHKKVLCLADNDICMDRQRHLGFLAAMGKTEEAGKENGDFWLVPMTADGRREFYRERLGKLMEYTAVFAVSDYYAIELISFLQEQGIGVPEEISVAGFDDCPLGGKIHPALTTIRQDGKRRAQLAVAVLRRLKAGDLESEGKTYTLPVELVRRQSVKHIEER